MSSDSKIDIGDSEVDMEHITTLAKLPRVGDEGTAENFLRKTYPELTDTKINVLVSIIDREKLYLATQEVVRQAGGDAENAAKLLLKTHPHLTKAQAKAVVIDFTASAEGKPRTAPVQYGVEEFRKINPKLNKSEADAVMHGFIAQGFDATSAAHLAGRSPQEIKLRKGLSSFDEQVQKIGNVPLSAASSLKRMKDKLSFREYYQLTEKNEKLSSELDKLDREYIHYEQGQRPRWKYRYELARDRLNREYAENSRRAAFGGLAVPQEVIDDLETPDWDQQEEAGNDIVDAKKRREDIIEELQTVRKELKDLPKTSKPSQGVAPVDLTGKSAEEHVRLKRILGYPGLAAAATGATLGTKALVDQIAGKRKSKHTERRYNKRRTSKRRYRTSKRRYNRTSKRRSTKRRITKKRYNKRK